MKSMFHIIFTSLLVTNCTIPKFETHTARKSAGAIPLEWSMVSSSRSIQANWIAQFNDPALSALVLEAQQHNRELQSLAANIERSKALARQAGSALFPNANLIISSNRNSEAGLRTDHQNTSLNISWEIDIWGRIRSERKAALASAQAVEADYHFAQYSLAAAVARAYFTAIDARTQASILKQLESGLQHINKIVKFQLQEGVASKQDLAVSRSDLAAIRSRLAAADMATRDSLRALELLLGRYPSAEIGVRWELPTAPPMPGPGLPSELLERRPDVIAAEQRVAAAFYTVNVAKTARLPRLSLTALSGGTAAELSNILDRDNRSWSIGTELLAPIFQGGALKAQVENANAAQKAAIAAYGQAALNSFNDVESSLDAGTVLVQQEEQLEQAYESANEPYRIAKLRFDEGDIHIFDLLSVQQRVFNRELELMTIKRSILEQRVNLYLALGGAWN